MSESPKSYTVAPGKYLGAIARNMLGNFWWIFLIPCAFFIAGFADWRWAVVGLIILMLIFPAIITIALLNHSLRPEVVRRSAANAVSFEGNNVTLYKISDDTIKLIETAKFMEIMVSGRLTKLIIGPHIYDFILIPTDLLPKGLDITY